MTHGRVTIVIVTYNSGDELDDCLQSVERESGCSVVVIDNDSNKAAKERLREAHRVGLIDTLIFNEENVGFARAVNAVLRGIADGDVLLLNPDARLEPGALGLLLAAAQEHGSAGILSPMVFSGKDVRTITAGRQPRLWPMFTHYSGLSRLSRRFPSLEGRYLFLAHGIQPAQRVEWVAGCSMLLKRELLNQVGMLSERWFMYGEDVEYCQRALGAGWDVLVIRDSRCFHAMGTSVKSASASVNTMWPRNLTDYYKHTFKPSAPTFFAWRLVFSGGLMSRAAAFTLRDVARGTGTAEARRFALFSRAVWSSPR